MSIKVMTRVWERSTASGSELLMLLAIADYADDDGRAWPSVGTLARKSRTGERNANYLLKALQERGELRVHRGAGRNGTNVYQVLCFGEMVQPSAPVQATAPPHPGAALHLAAPIQDQLQGARPSLLSGCRQDANGLPSGELQAGAGGDASAFLPG